MIKLLRIILCPLIFLYGAFIAIGGVLFPTTILMIFSFYGMILEPIVWLFNKTGSNIKNFDPFIDEYESTFINHFLGFTIIIWLPFYMSYLYISTGEIFNFD